MVPHLTVWWRIMKIQIAGLSEGSHSYQFREPVAHVGLGEEFSGEVEVVGSLRLRQMRRAIPSHGYLNVPDVLRMGLTRGGHT